MPEICELDLAALELIRDNVRRFQNESIAKLRGSNLRILDVAPQDHGSLSRIIPAGSSYETLDIDPLSGATYIADLTKKTEIPDNHYDAVFCTEVIEHVSNPFLATAEVLRILKPDGFAFFSSPFAFRIHGPLPDNWRVTEHGWRELLSNYIRVSISSLEDPSRFLMPIHYTVVAQKPSHH